jgi:hypothetical protein
MRLRGLAGFALLAALPWTLSALNLAEQSSTREVQGQDMDAIRSYSDHVGRGWLRDSIGVDLDKLAVEWDPSDLSFRRPQPVRAAPSAPGGPDAAPAPKPGLEGNVTFKLEQVDDLLRLTKDIRDVPFGLSVEGRLSLGLGLAALKTKLWVPFSWRDQWRAEAVMPFRFSDAGRRIRLHSDFRNQLGLNDLQAGLGTDLKGDVWGIWGLNYDFHRRFGQGSNEAIHWLKLSKQF